MMSTEIQEISNSTKSTDHPLHELTKQMVKIVTFKTALSQDINIIQSNLNSVEQKVHSANINYKNEIIKMKSKTRSLKNMIEVNESKLIELRLTIAQQELTKQQLLDDQIIKEAELKDSSSAVTTCDTLLPEKKQALETAQLKLNELREKSVKSQTLFTETLESKKLLESQLISGIVELNTDIAAYEADLENNLRPELVQVTDQCDTLLTTIQSMEVYIKTETDQHQQMNARMADLTNSSTRTQLDIQKVEQELSTTIANNNNKSQIYQSILNDTSMGMKEGVDNMQAEYAAIDREIELLQRLVSNELTCYIKSQQSVCHFLPHFQLYIYL